MSNEFSLLLATCYFLLTTSYLFIQQALTKIMFNAIKELVTSPDTHRYRVLSAGFQSSQIGVSCPKTPLI